MKHTHFLLIFAALFISAKVLASPDTIPLERVMREFQARYYAAGGNYYQWPEVFNCLQGSLCPPMPNDEFYGSELTDANRATELVQALHDVFMDSNIYFRYAREPIEFIPYTNQFGTTYDIRNYSLDDFPEIQPENVSKQNFAAMLSSFESAVKELKGIGELNTSNNNQYSIANDFHVTVYSKSVDGGHSYPNHDRTEWDRTHYSYNENVENPAYPGAISNDPKLWPLILITKSDATYSWNNISWGTDPYNIAAYLEQHTSYCNVLGREIDCEINKYSDPCGGGPHPALDYLTYVIVQYALIEYNTLSYFPMIAKDTKGKIQYYFNYVISDSGQAGSHAPLDGGTNEYQWLTSEDFIREFSTPSDIVLELNDHAIDVMGNSVAMEDLFDYNFERLPLYEIGDECWNSGWMISDFAVVIYPEFDTTTESEKSCCTECADGDCPPGKANFSLGSVQISIPLGNQMDSNSSAGELYISEPNPDDKLGSNKCLHYRGFIKEEDAQVRYSGSPFGQGIEQIMAPQVFVDVVNNFNNDPNRWQIRFYREYDPSWNAWYDPHPPNENNRYHTIDFVWDEGISTLTITETGELGNNTKAYRWNSQGGNTSDCSLIYYDSTYGTGSGGRLKEERSIKTYTEEDELIKRKKIIDGDGIILEDRQDTYAQFDWGRELVSSIEYLLTEEDQDGGRYKETVYSYSSAGAGGKLQYWETQYYEDETVIGKDTWSSYEYYDSQDPVAQGRIKKVITPYLGSTRLQGESAGRCLEYFYSNPELDDVGDEDADLVLRVDEKIAGTVIRRTFTVEASGEVYNAVNPDDGYNSNDRYYDYTERLNITCLDLGIQTIEDALASGNQAKVLVSKERYYASEEHKNKLRSSLTHDNQLSVYLYGGGNLSTTTYQGVPDADGDMVVKGIESLEVKNEFGTIIHREKRSIPDNYLLAYEEATLVDNYGRVLSGNAFDHTAAIELPVPEVLHLKLDEGSGQTAADTGSDTTANTGTRYEGNSQANSGNGPVWTSGHTGSGLFLDGTNDSLRIADANNLELAGSFTLALWIKLDSTVLSSTTAMRLMAKKNISSANDGYEWYYQPSSKTLRFYGRSTNFAQATLADALDDEWHHLLVAVSGTQVAFYLDGIALTADDSTINAPTSNSQHLYIGRLGNNTAHFKGTVDDIRIYNRLLSTSEKQKLAGIYQGPPTSVTFTRQYSCCGLESETDRMGVTTTYTYDALGRRRTETSNGLTRHISLDALGRVTKEEISNGSALLLHETKYNSWGQLEKFIEPYADSVRTWSYEYDYTDDAFDITTAKIASAVMSVEKRYKDGAIYETVGPALYGQRHNYSVVSGQTSSVIVVGQNSPVSSLSFNAVVTQRTRLDADGDPTNEWVKNYSDMAGRNYKTVLPEILDAEAQGAASDGPSLLTYFNPQSRLVKVVDADGQVLLHTYSESGELRDTALSVNGDNTIDYAGTDRVQRTESDFGLYEGKVVRWSKEYVWEMDNSDTPTLTQSLYHTVDGLESWVVLFEGTAQEQITHSLTDYNTAAKSLTRTTHMPDGSVEESILAETSTERIEKFTFSNASLSPEIIAETVSTYPNSAYRRLASQQQRKDAVGNTSQFEYFKDGRIKTLSTPDPITGESGEGKDAQTISHAYQFDPEEGETHTTTLPDDSTQVTVYYLTGDVKSRAGAQVNPMELRYDYAGRLIEMTTWQDFSGESGEAVTIWHYNNRGLLRQKELPDQQGPIYGYHPSGRLESRTLARGTVITLTYDPDTFDLSGISYSDSTLGAAYQYDRMGRLKQASDASGLRELRYDSLRLKEVEYTSGLLAGWKLVYPPDELLRSGGLKLWQESTLEYEVAYGYDEASRFSTVSNGQKVVTYAYTPYAGNQLQSLTFTHNSQPILSTQTPRDALGRLASITHQAAGFGGGHGYTLAYNDLNQIIKRTETDGAYWQYGYDGLGQLNSAVKKTSQDATMTGYSYGFDFDDIGNRTQTTVNGRTATYTPNTLNQYQNRTVPGAVDILGEAHPDAAVTVNGQSVQRTNTLFYKEVATDNSASPVWQEIDVLAVLAGAGHGGSDAAAEENGHQYLPETPESYEYDEDGNLRSDGRWSYAWDGENRLKSMTTSATATAAGTPNLRLEFTYDSQGRRVHKQVFLDNQLQESRYFLYDGWNLIYEYSLNAANTVKTKASYVWGLDASGSLQGAGGVGGLLWINNLKDNEADREGSYFTAYDHNGNVMALVESETGTVTASYEYGPFGEAIRSSGPMAKRNPFTFSTKYLDAETGLHYYGYRYYSASIGRWLNRDPIGEAGGLNVYGFVENNPVNKWDYLGLADITVDGINWRTPSVADINHVHKLPNGKDAGVHLHGSDGSKYFPEHNMILDKNKRWITASPKFKDKMKKAVECELKGKPRSAMIRYLATVSLAAIIFDLSSSDASAQELKILYINYRNAVLANDKNTQTEYAAWIAAWVKDNGGHYSGATVILGKLIPD